MTFNSSATITSEIERARKRKTDFMKASVVAIDEKKIAERIVHQIGVKSARSLGRSDLKRTGFGEWPQLGFEQNGHCLLYGL